MKKLILALLVATQFVTAACSKDQVAPSIAAKADGTADAGGGTIEKSTEAEVRAAVDEALKIATDKDYQSRLYIARSKYTYKLNSAERDRIYTIQSILINPPHAALVPFLGIEGPDLNRMENLMSKYSKENLSEYIDPNNIYFLESGSCPAHDKKDADASVSKFDLNAKICFSLENLKKIPKESLLKHLTGLWIHEITHMFGFDEKSAVLIQNKAIDTFDQIFDNSRIRLPSIILHNAFSSWNSLEFILIMIKVGEGQTLNGILLTQSSMSNLYRYSLGRSQGLNDSILEAFRKNVLTPPVFRNREMQLIADRAENKLELVNDFINKSLSTPNEQLFSEEFLKQLKAQSALLESAVKDLEELQKLLDAN